MLTMKIRLIIAVGIVAAFLFITRTVVKKKLDVKNSLLWYVMLVIIGVFDLFPSLLGALAEFVGISAPVNMMFFFGFIFSLLIIFYLTTALFRITSSQRKLTQELALIRKELNMLQQTAQETDGTDEEQG